MTLASSLYMRELGDRIKSANPIELLAENKATDVSENKACSLSARPSSIRSTFLIVFSPDRSKIASTHGDHHVRITDVKSSLTTHVLKGHRRTPWCLAFHPASNHLLASGCLSGEVRLWDLHGGGSEKWNCTAVISSLTFHPTDQLLVIATACCLYFWDWTENEQPFARSITRKMHDKVRWVRFDPLGHYLYTGISNSATINQENSATYIGVQEELPSAATDDTMPAARQRYQDLIDVYNQERAAIIISSPDTSEDEIPRRRTLSPAAVYGLQQARVYARSTREQAQEHRLNCPHMRNQRRPSNQQPSSSHTTNVSSPNTSSNRLDLSHVPSVFGMLSADSMSTVLENPLLSSSAESLADSARRVVEAMRSINPDIPVSHRLDLSDEDTSQNNERSNITNDSGSFIVTSSQPSSFSFGGNSSTTDNPAPTVQQITSEYNTRQRSILRSTLHALYNGPTMFSSRGTRQEDMNENSVISGITEPRSSSIPSILEPIDMDENSVISAITEPASSSIPSIVEPRPSLTSEASAAPSNGDRSRIQDVRSVSMTLHARQDMLRRRLDAIHHRYERLQDNISLRRNQEGSTTSSLYHEHSNRRFSRSGRDAARMRSRLRQSMRERERERHWHTLQRRSLHPHYAIGILDETINRPNDSVQEAINRTIAGAYMLGTDQHAVADNIINLTHRIQRWDMRHPNTIPDISRSEDNVIISTCQLHNDATIDISQDGCYLATFVNNHRGFPDPTILAVFSLAEKSLGECLYTKSFGPNAISVSLSPKNNYVLVGLAARRLTWVYTPNQLIGQVFKLVRPKGGENSMSHVSDIYHPCSSNTLTHVSVNIARWLPEAGGGICYGTNRGDLHICRPGLSRKPDVKEDDDSDVHNIRRNILQMLEITVPRTISTSTQTADDIRIGGTQTDSD